MKIRYYFKGIGSRLQTLKTDRRKTYYSVELPILLMTLTGSFSAIILAQLLTGC
jgi:hypothetical protein